MKNIIVLVAFAWFAALLGTEIAHSFVEFVIYGGTAFATATGTLCYMVLKGI